MYNEMYYHSWFSLRSSQGFSQELAQAASVKTVIHLAVNEVLYSTEVPLS